MDREEEESFIVSKWKATKIMTAEEGAENDRLYSFLKDNIPELLHHTGLAAFDEHLKGVKTVLQLWEASKDVCNAGLFHSIYGTEGFQGYKFPILRRREIRNLIGEEAERLVWIFCVVDRKTVDAVVLSLEVREGLQLPETIIFRSREELGAFEIPLQGVNEFLNFIQLTLADWLEQVEGASRKANTLFEWKLGEAWQYRRLAYERMKDILFQQKKNEYHAMKVMYDEIYAQESADTRHLHQPITPPMSQAAKDARDALSSRYI